MAKRRNREAKILELVQRHGFVTIDALAREFEVTPQTVRRDINHLAQQSQVRRYHGGAGLPSSVENLSYSTRKILNHAGKQRIAQLLARHIPNDASVFINIGTTNEEVARALLDHSGLRVITNNLNVANILAGQTGFEVIIAGGLVRHRDRGVIGEATLDLINQFKVDVGVIGISGIDEDGALLEFDYREVRVAQAIIANSRRVCLAVDYSKFGRNAMVRQGSITQVDAFFTDRPPPDEIVRLLEEHGIELHVAD
ncbi:MAG: DeoR family transcriptional regulator [Alphaproteobacteria bacterium]|jgi:DeoR family glycerol-3-phosphate regulon repressor|nr:DeoR family transcriptional regulator [Alphaproteobacteria bacterium]MDP6813788.1 DeoR family transcriptional regulator [Alphaproteobacteria bacterium]